MENEKGRKTKKKTGNIARNQEIPNNLNVFQQFHKFTCHEKKIEIDKDRKGKT